MGIRFRSYKNEGDYEAVRALIMRKFENPELRFYPSLGDLDYIRTMEEEDNTFQENVTICEIENGKVIGAIWPGFYRILYCVTGLEYAHLEDEILDWAEQRYCGPSLEDRIGQEVYIWGYEEDTLRTDILKARGYSKHTWYMYSGVKDLQNQITSPNFPKGYMARPILPQDIEQKVEIMGVSAGLGVPKMEKYRRLMDSPTYRKDLDLVVVDQNDQVVAFANIWHDVHNHIAIIEPFGTKESHRRKGLATNLLYESMERLKELGLSKLYINHGGLWTLDPEPDDALRVYTKDGFKELGEMFVWFRAL